jgi:hypothetical protein
VDVASISTVSPAEGQLGTYVTIEGHNLLGGGKSITEVTLAGISVEEIISFKNDQVVVRAGSGGTSSGVVRLIADTGAQITSHVWTYKAPSFIKGINPSSGQGGAIVTISGENLRGSGTSVTNVTLNGFQANIQAQTNSEVIIVVPYTGTTTVSTPIVLIADTGARTSLPANWTFLDDGSIDNVEPAAGQFGTFVNISGTNLLGGGDSVTSVTLGGKQATVIDATDTLVQVNAGEGSTASATEEDVVITTDTGAKIVKLAAWKYVEPGQILFVEPRNGQGGTEVAIAGTLLCGGGTKITEVLLAGKKADIETNSCSFVRVKANEYGANINGEIIVISDTGARVVDLEGFTYVAPGNIDSVTPNAGQAGSQVTIKGTNIFGGGSSATSVTLGGVPATIQGSNSNSNEIVVVPNPGPLSKEFITGDVVIIGDTNIETRLVQGWTYSVVSSIEPSSGQDGTYVTITGTRLLAGGSQATTVTLAGFPANIDTDMSNETQILVRGPKLELLSSREGSV